MSVTLIADDLTGACDAGALFAGRGKVGVLTDSAAAGPGWEVLAIDTESRGLTPEHAAARVAHTARQLGPRLDHGRIFKKIDSTVRGAVAAELEALLTGTGRDRALVCPTFPGQQRTVRGGILRVGGIPVHQSAIGRDPSFPGPTSDVVEILRRGTPRPVRHLSLAEVRSGDHALATVLADRGEAVIVADAERDTDLDALARAAVAHPLVVPAGSAALAGAISRALGHAGAPVPLPDGRAWLILVGSLHPASRAQIAALRAAGVAGATLESAGQRALDDLAREIERGRPAFLVTDEAGAPDPDTRADTARRLAGSAARLLSRARPDLVVVTGGETAHALLVALGASRLDVLGAPASGLALADLVTGESTLPVLTKAGGFGGPELLCTLLEGRA